MKKLVVLLLIFIPLFLWGEGNENKTDPDGFSMGGMAGGYSVNGVNYNRIRLMPEFTYGKFGIGLDFDLLLDEEGDLRKEDWDEFEDYINKIYYIRYGNRGDSFYAKVGGFTDYTLGHGLIMKNYTNMLRYPEVRQVGAMVGGVMPMMNIAPEFFTSDVTENEILAGKISFAPLSSTQIPLLSGLQVSVLGAMDRNQYGGMDDKDNDKYPDIFDDFPDDKQFWQDTDGDGIPDKDANGNWIDADLDGDNLPDAQYAEQEGVTIGTNPADLAYWDYDVHPKNMYKYDKEDEVSVIGLNYDLPLYQSDLLSIGHYGEVAQIIDHSYGFIFPGFYANFLIFKTNLEFRKYDYDFEPAFFDRLYDDKRAVVVGDTLLTKESFISSNVAQAGWYGSLTADILKVISLDVAYEDMYAKDNYNGKSIWGALTVQPNLIPKLSIMQVSYSQTREKNVLKYMRTPNSELNAKAGYDISPNTALVYNYKEHYIDADSNGKIKGNDEIIRTYGFGVEFKF